MALNYIWSGFFLVGFLAAVLQWLFLGDTDIFKRIIDGTFETARMGVMDIALPLAGVMTLWLGIMNIGEKAGMDGEMIRRLLASDADRDEVQRRELHARERGVDGHVLDSCDLLERHVAVRSHQEHLALLFR